MAQIKIKGKLDSFYRARNAFLISVLVAILINNPYTSLYIPTADILKSNIENYYANPNILEFYGTIMGLLFAAYTVLISMMPIFHPDSLKQPVFTHVNRLFVYTILIGLLSLLSNFIISVISSLRGSNYEGFVETFLFLSLVIGMVFAVLSLSDIFNIVRGKKMTREMEEEKERKRKKTETTN